jgi:hypothetical protein
LEVTIMSAFIVDPAHVDVVLSTAINGPSDAHLSCGLSWHAPYVDELLEGSASGPLTPERADEAGQALLAECVASVSYLYDEPLGSLPGPVPNPDPQQYEWTNFGRILTAIECCSALDCYEYQSCEHPGWEDSGARVFCERLRRSLVGCMEGYEAAAWGWSAELVLARAQERIGLSP